jgi:cytoskeletal protein RodZ
MKRSFNGLLEGIVLGLAVPTLAIAVTMTSADYSAAKSKASADYKAAKAQCDTLKDNPKDVCIAEAKAAEKKAKAEAEAQYKNTDKARRDARIEAAEADYKVAKAKCGAMKGNEKDVCIKEAKATETKAKADAKASQKVATARQDATEDKLEADYKVAKEKCDALSGAAKDQCINNAKARYKK